MGQPRKSATSKMDMETFTNAQLTQAGSQKTLFPQSQVPQSRQGVGVFKVNINDVHRRRATPQRDDHGRRSTASGFDNTIMDAAKVKEIVDDQTSQRTLSLKSHGSLPNRVPSPPHAPQQKITDQYTVGFAHGQVDDLKDIMDVMHGQQEDTQSASYDEEHSDSQSEDQNDIEDSIEQGLSPLQQSRTLKRGYASDAQNHKIQYSQSKSQQAWSQVHTRQHAGGKIPGLNRQLGSNQRSQSAMIFREHLADEANVSQTSQHHTVADAHCPNATVDHVLPDFTTGADRLDNASFYSQRPPRRNGHHVAKDAPRKQSKHMTQRKQSHQFDVVVNDRPLSRSPQNLHFDDGTVDVAELDYDLEKLSTMPFKQLAEESFDHMTRSFGDKRTLEEHVARGQHFTAEDQRRLFDELDINDWETAGEWFLSQFGQLMQDIVAARKSKRELASTFEAKIAQRQGVVDAREEQIKHALKGMKQGGRGILRDENSEETVGRNAGTDGSARS